MVRHRSVPSTPRRRLSRPLALLSAVVLAGTGLALRPLSAPAALAGYAEFQTLSGSSRDFTTVMQQRPAGFPAAEVRSTSVGGSGVGVQSGASAFLPPQTPVGQEYGSSRGEPYLNLRPNGLSAAAPSVTTYSFARPTPSSGWTFVLGDVDADQVTITATDADDQPVSAAELGFRGVFNYCAPGVSPKPSCAPPNNDGTDLPTWLSETSTLRGNSRALDTAGASGWFEPRVPIKTLTFTYTQRSGSPVFQTWFSALQYRLSGTVQVPGSLTDPVTVHLYDPSGAVVGTTTTDADGRYDFPGQATYDNYRVEVVRPDGYTSDAPLSRRVNLSNGNQTADFALREIEPVPVSGTVVDSDQLPAAGVTIRLMDAADDAVDTAITGPNGSYLFDRVPVGDDYRIEPTVPEGYTSAPTQATFSVPPDTEDPITVDPFTLTAMPTGTISGRVRDVDSGDPIAGVSIRLSGVNGAEYDLVTADDGSYDLTDLPAGVYTVEPRPAEGVEVVDPESLTVTIPSGGGVFGNRDFELRLPAPAPTSTLSGSVLGPQNEPVPGSAVEVTLPDDGGTVTVETANDGSFSVPDLPAAAGYQVTVLPPDGYEADAPATRDVDLGDDVSGLEFTLRPTVVSSPSTSADPSSSASQSPSQSPSQSAGPTVSAEPSSPAPSGTSSAPVAATSSSSPVGAVAGNGLADTGGPSALLLWVGGAAVVVGGLCLVGARVRSARRTH